MSHDELWSKLKVAEEYNANGEFVNAEEAARETIRQLAEHKKNGGEELHIRALLILAESLWNRGLAKDALPIAEQALPQLNNDTNPRIKELKAKTFGWIGTIYRSLSEYAKAIEYSEKALELSEELGNNRGVAQAVNNIGIAYKSLSQYTKATQYLEKALRLHVELGNKKGVADATNNIGVVYYRLSEYTKALEYHEKALALNDELGNIQGVSEVTSNIATVYYYISNYTKALEYDKKALALSEELGNKHMSARQMANIGLLYTDISEYAKAIESNEKALLLFEELGVKESVAIVTNNIGHVYFSLSEYSKALEYHKKALALREELGDKQGVGSSSSNIGVVYAKLEDFPQSLIYLQKAVEFSEDIGDKRVLGYALAGIGETLRKMGRNTEAMEYFQRALHLRREEIKTNDGVAVTLILIGSLLSEENRFSDAIEKLDEGLALAEKVGDKKPESDAHKELANIYAKQGDTALALEHLQKHLALEKEMYSEESRKRIESFNIRMALAEKEKEKEIMKIKSAKLEEQLANSAIHLATQTEMLGNFRNEMRAIVQEINEPISALKKIKEKLKELPCESVDWVKFEKEFTTVHPEFRAKLTGKYPELTKQEIKMCQLARLGLKTYEMSRLLCLSERTIDGHRNNLRKKLGLKSNENLRDFLQGIR